MKNYFLNRAERKFLPEINLTIESNIVYAKHRKLKAIWSFDNFEDIRFYKLGSFEFKAEDLTGSIPMESFK